MKNQREVESKIKYLLDNPDFGKDIIGIIPSGQRVKSNCFGTVAYVHDISYPEEGLDKEGFPKSYEGYRAVLGETELSKFYPGSSWPGYMEWDVFREVMKKDYHEIKFDEKQFGDLIAFGHEDDIVSNGINSRPLHAGIFLGDNMVFEQEHYGGIFQEVDFMDNLRRYTGALTLRKK